MHLIVGATGLLGRALEERLTRNAVKHVAASRRAGASGLGIDLAADPAEWRIPAGVTAAYLCAAETSVQACEAEPERTGRINVERTLELARRLVEGGAFVVFPSTNLVFDGSRAIFHEEDSASPVTEYGRQKARAEAGLRRLPSDRVAIVRLSKVLHPAMPLVRGWAEALRRGERVRAFSNLRFSPIAPAFVAEALCAIGDRRFAGITQLAGSGQISYYDLALAIAERLGAEKSLVISTEIPDGPARSAALDPERVTRELGLPPPDVAQTVRKLIDSLV